MNKKGFTLIELLAVIVILAIIALIATPAVLNIIEDSKESAAKDSAMVIAKSAETYYVSNATLLGKEVGTIDLTTGELQYKGEKPEKGYVKFDDKGNSYLKMYMNGYCVVSDYDNTVVSEKMESADCDATMKVTYTKYEDGEAVYFNPITNSACKDTDYVLSNSTNEYKGTEANGCLKWYAFLDSDEDSTIRLLLDHDTSAASLSWADAQMEIANAKDDTVNLYGWHEDVRGTVRLISAEEVNEIAPDTAGTWTKHSEYYYLHTGNTTEYMGPAGTNKYAWLFDNIENCEIFGCNVAQEGGHWGYYTSTEFGDSSYNYYWHIWQSGALNPSPDYRAVRPVIEVSKAKFTN